VDFQQAAETPSDEGSIQLFLSGFTARDLAEPLASFDESTPISIVRSALKGRSLAFVGIRQQGLVTGWMAASDFDDKAALTARPLDTASIIADTASLDVVVAALDRTPCLLVRSLGQIGGLICRRDLQKPAMRMWPFGLVTISELRVTRMIEEYCPQESWRQYLSPGRLQKANAFLVVRRERGQQHSLLDCLQFADKGRIVARHAPLREQTRFASKRDAERFIASLQQLRDNLAHAQDISGDWEVIRDLAMNLHRIVLGPNPARDR
jgi:hypothetical protein